MTLREAILAYVDRFRVVDSSILMDALAESIPNISDQVKLQTLSEMVQSNTLKRYDYILPSRTERQFYMPGEFRIKF